MQANRELDKKEIAKLAEENKGLEHKIGLLTAESDKITSGYEQVNFPKKISNRK